VTDKQTIDYYDDFAGWYENGRQRGYHAMLDALELEVLTPYAEDKDVLEVGAGTGLIMAGLNAMPRSLVGLDISAGMLKKASLRGFKVVQGSATALPFDSGRFDVVYSFKVLAHIPDIEAAVAEMVRVLRSGGHLIAEFYNARSLRRLAKRLAGPGQISENRNEDDVFTRWDTPKDIISYLPPNVELKGWRGIRVLTPAAAVFKLPGMEKVLPKLEKRAMSSPLAAFGGFLVAICQKR
jgi:ubiquinone/menaquinone biosynthesis C-methylase UbiE